MEQPIKIQNEAISSQLQKQMMDSTNNAIGWNSGHWTESENAKCIAYFQFNKTHLHSKLKMKENKFFKQMSIFIATRGPIQCRSQCQKLLRKHKTFYNIIQSFKEEYGSHRFDVEFGEHSQNPLIRFKGTLEMISYEKQAEQRRDVQIQTQTSFLLRKSMKKLAQNDANATSQNSFPFLKVGWWL